MFCQSMGKKKDAGDDPDVTHGALVGARVVVEPGTEKVLLKFLGEGELELSQNLAFQ